MLSSQFEHVFISGYKINYFFSTLLSKDSDFLAELNQYKIEGPLAEGLSEKSPRYQESLLSRSLLLEAIKFYKKKRVGGMAFSLSHTQGAALVAAGASLRFEGARLAAGIGADLESSQRKISEAAYKRIVKGAFDSKIQALHLWCLKEAAYKAHPQNENLLLSDFVVTEIQEAAHFTILCNKSEMRFESSIFNRGSYTIALARLV